MKVLPIHFVGIAMIVIIIFLFIVLLIPVDKIKKRKKKKRDEDQLAPPKDWEKVCKILEAKYEAIRKEVSRANKNLEEKEKMVIVEQVKVKKLEEKIAQEREWNKKEENNALKKTEGFSKLKIELQNMQESYNKEYLSNIKLQKDISLVEKNLESECAKRRGLESLNMELKNKSDEMRRDAAHLKKEINELKKKKEDESWVAKADYLRIERELKELQKEIERIKRNEK